MPRTEILSAVEREEFEAPPVFTPAQQHQYFDPPLEVVRTLKRLKTPTNQIYFLVSYGYFRATSRFFPYQRFRQADIRYVSHTLGWPLKHIRSTPYAPETQSRHRHLVRTLCQFRFCDQMARKMLQTEILTLTQLHWQPRDIFLRSIEWLTANRIEIPGADALSRLIAHALTHRRLTFARRLDQLLTPSLRHSLQALLESPHHSAETEPYRLTQFKRLSQSTKPAKVRARLEEFQHIREQYQLVAPLLPRLNLPQAGITYYATIALKLDSFDLARRPEHDRLLHLLAFIVHHYCRLQDNLIDVFLNVLPTILNSVRREHMEQCYATRETHAMSLTALLTLLETDVLTAFKTIKRIVDSSSSNDTEKVQQIRQLLTKRALPQQQLMETIDPLKGSLTDTTNRESYYAVLEARSLRLQTRLTPILKSLPWEGTDQSLLATIRHYQDRQGNIDHTAPQRFLMPIERKAVSPPDRPFRVSLYKALLFIHVRQGIKGGTLYLEHSYKYRALEGYLLSREQWQQYRHKYVKQANLQPFANPRLVLEDLERHLQEQYVTTNTRLLDNQNAYVSQKADASLLVKTPAQPTVNTEALSTFFPGRHYVALTEILATVHQLTQFLDELQHGQQQLRRARPPMRTFLAGLLGLGCGIGVRKLARISRHLQEGQVEHAVNWYFTATNLRAANDRILRMMDHLPLPTIYQRSPEALLHTSSDGQKFEVPAESLNANYSYKYFGKGQGVSVYSFIDERHLLFYSTVINAAERESTYVLDGLLQQEGAQSSMHSTDTHGYSELVFGLMHLLGLDYAPRIKNFQRQHLYAFKRLRHADGYASFLVKPHGSINVPLILDQWEDMLRFAATIKLKVTPPSELFRRLNSYSTQHVLYRALKAFGQVLKSLFLLRYLDNVELRQQITQQLNKVEQSHRFTRALSIGTPRGFLSVDKEAQEVEEGCRRLIKNAVTCWNYVYLSKRIFKTADPDFQHLLIEAIRHGSPISWQHINLLGEYDFSDKRLEDSMGILPATWLTEKEGAFRKALNV